MRTTKLRLLAAVLALPTAIGSTAVASPCGSPEHRQFDFWLGDWRVHAPDGKFVGLNRITSEYDGCVVHERYATGRGYSGESLNTYDAGRRAWRQSWVDNQGLVLLLEGGLRDGSMVLEGETRDEKGQATRHRITWTPNADGTVRQHWQSTDARGQWTTAFDGLYSRR